MSTPRLTLVPTPIGNLADITLRALDTLKTCDLILCEDTRHSAKLLAHYGIEKKTTALHQHNEHRAVDALVNQLLEGKHFAVITDAGTPGISDPGFLIVRRCIEKGVAVECLPGATALVPALVASGLPSERFSFYGFPPAKKGRQTFWQQLATESKTCVLYESPHRIARTLSEAAQWLGAERGACLVRELSKLHESQHRGTLAELAAEATKGTFRGEIVLVIAPA